jgi:hypothetical protein
LKWDVGQLFFGSPFLLVRFLLAMQKKMNEDADECMGLEELVKQQQALITEWTLFQENMLWYI